MLQILFSYIENLSSILNCKIYFVKELYCASKIPCIRTTCTKQQLLPGMVKTDGCCFHFIFKSRQIFVFFTELYSARNSAWTSLTVICSVVSITAVLPSCVRKDNGKGLVLTVP